MKHFATRGALLLGLLFQHVFAASEATSHVRSIYLFKDVMKSDTISLKTSGFNSVIIFGIGILANGDIMYYSNTPGSNDTLVASNGGYVGSVELAEKVLSFKTGTTDINRVEISTNAAHIGDLMSSPGPGSTTRVYRNFAALKAAWNLDAVNSDDESIYDISSTVTFAKMLGAIGYKYTIAPYTYENFWATIISQINKGLTSPLLDRAYLQCYDGGAGNDPASWQSYLGMKVVPLVWVTNDSKPYDGSTPAQANASFKSWVSEGTLAGGGYWNDYDIEKMGSSYTAYAGVLKTWFP